MNTRKKRCPHCDRLIDPRGMQTHLKACVQKQLGTPATPAPVAPVEPPKVTHSTVITTTVRDGQIQVEITAI